MSWFHRGAARAPRATLPELGDDEANVPNPVTETPPPDRFCDLVLTGGVASGVVYPWAIVELARAFHFKSIGGTSVGAMAAALAAAAEYGRRCGAPAAFEVLRRLPGQLAEDAGDKRTRMLALFQPAPRGQRLFDLFVDAVKVWASGSKPRFWQKLTWLGRALWAFRCEAGVAALLAMAACGLVGVTVVRCLANQGWAYGWSWLLALLPVALIAAVIGIVCALAGDVRHGVIANDLGLVRGRAADGRDAKNEPGLVDWLHEGIQRSAGFNPDDPQSPPLTFRDLWRAPAYAGAPPRDGRPTDARKERSIHLEMITTNVTHGRPYRLPLDDESTRLYFRPGDLTAFFPRDVMCALMRVAEPYRPLSGSDPAAEHGVGLYLLPSADLPIVVAARLSLSYPLLFSAVPLYAVDYEMPLGQRELKPCRFSDGGICSNFPIHLFDSAAPRWPTFGMWLGKRGPYHHRPVWLPENHLSGRGDAWHRFAPTNSDTTGVPLWRTLFGFLVGVGLSAKDWSDNSSMRMPNVRNRVARLNLCRGEGELNIAMPRQRILRMAQTYGTAAGRLFVNDFVAGPGEIPRPAWREHQWVRLHTLLYSLREYLAGLGEASRNATHSMPLRALIDRATRRHGARAVGAGAGAPAESPVRMPTPDQDPAGSELGAMPAGTPRGRAGTTPPPKQTLEPYRAEALKQMLDAAEALEAALARCNVALPYKALPTPSLRVRPPI